MTNEQRLAELGETLPPAPKPAGLYKTTFSAGALTVVSGHPPLEADGTRIVGKVGDTMDVDEARRAARQCGLTILATLKGALGSLDRVKGVMRIFGMVNAAPDFQLHPAVIDGCSELFAQVFGPDAGVGVRCAMGASSLPYNTAVEIEATFIVEG